MVKGIYFLKMPEFKSNKQKLEILIDKLLKKVFEKNLFSQKILIEVADKNKSCQNLQTISRFALWWNRTVIVHPRFNDNFAISFSKVLLKEIKNAIQVLVLLKK